MPTLLSPDAAQADKAPTLSVSPSQLCARRPVLLARVGGVLLRRSKFVARWLLWSWRHGSTKHATWVCHFEGYWW